jgi:hypothetical protein
VAFVALMTAAGCGNGDGDGSAAVDLADRIPEGQLPTISAMDLVAAREALGLPDDFAGDSFETDPEKRFVAAAGVAIPTIARPQETPFRAAVDLGQVTAAASSIGFAPDQVTVVETEQDFEEVASSLEEDGYERDGDVLMTDDLGATVGYRVVAGGEGVIAAGQEAEPVEAAAAGPLDPAPAGPARELLAELDAPSATATSFDGTTDCVTAVGVADELAEGEGELVLVTEDESVELVVEEGDEFGVFGGFELGERAAEDGRVVYPFAFPLGDLSGPSAFILGDNPAATLWDCG